MSYTVEITSEADLELLEVGGFIAIDNPQKAKEFVRSLVLHFTSTLSTFPKSGIVYQADLRKLSHQGYTAFYQINELKKKVYILHIVDLTKPLDSRGIDL